MFRRAISTLAGLLRRSRMEAGMADELRHHIESRAADLARTGLSHDEAHRQAQAEFGSLERYKDGCRDASGFRLMDELRADLRYAFRTLRQSAGFSAMAVLSLALGIGVNLSVFVSVYYTLLHPFPYPDLDRLVNVSTSRANARADKEPAAPADFIDWKQASRLFDSMAAFEEWDVNLTGVDRPDHIQAARVSGEFFDTLGMSPVRGRTFSRTECEPGKDNVVVLSYGFWQSRLGSQPHIIGDTLSLGGRKYTIIGVMPYEFNLPLSSELWVPLALTPEDRKQRGQQRLAVIGKLRPSITATQAAAEMDTIALGLEHRYPETNEGRRVRLTSFRDSVQTESWRFLIVLGAAAGFVLLLSCINVGSLQVARTMARQRELGLRTALGANIFRVFRQLLTESLVLGVSGGTLGIVLATWDVHIARSTIPPMVYRFVPGLRDLRINGEAIALAVILAIAASVLCCVPAIVQVFRQSRNTDLIGVLKEGGRSAGLSPSRNRLRAALVAGEVALAFVLLVGAGLMVATFQRMLNVHLGYDTHNVLRGDISLSGAAYEKPSRVAEFQDRVIRNVSSLPDVQSVAISRALGMTPAVLIEGRAKPGPAEPTPELHAASPKYIQTLRIPLVKGRWISEADGPDSPRIVVLSASVVRHYWPGSDPIGQRIKLGPPDSPWLTIVGVVGDVHEWFFGNPISTAYVSHRQSHPASMKVLLRTGQDPRSIAAALRREVQAIDWEQPVYNVKTLEEDMQEETSGVRNAARMMILYAAIALLLAVTGIYSISSFFVAQRTREIGVRISLGATGHTIMRMVLSQACVLGGIGLAVGLPVAILLATGMSHALYGIVSIQPHVIVVVMLVLGGLAVLAGYIPAFRASRVDPVIALRHE